MFKVGDWVSYDNGFEDVLFQIKEFEYSGIVKHGHKRIEEQYLKLWQPKEGEICWHLRYPQLVKVTEVFNDEFNCINYDGNRYTEYSSAMFEPFIGELPSFIKERK